MLASLVFVVYPCVLFLLFPSPEPAQPRSVFQTDSSGKNLGSGREPCVAAQAVPLIGLVAPPLRSRVPGHGGEPAQAEVRLRLQGAGRGRGGAARESGDA